MLRLINAILLVCTLVVTSVAVSFAHGQRHDQGMDLVICSGAELITITIGPDGQPVKKIQVCPDAVSIFAATSTNMQIPACSIRLLDRLVPLRDKVQSGQLRVIPSARGPPLAI
jgi:hypothetical protein